MKRFDILSNRFLFKLIQFGGDDGETRGPYRSAIGFILSHRNLTYAKIHTMKATLPRSEHASYREHRRQFAWQIVLPVVVSALLFIALIALISLSTFRGNGDVSRWAAISTIWIVIPIMLASLIFLLVLLGLIYLMARLLGLIPAYTGIAQNYVFRGAGYIRRLADAMVKPVFWIEALNANLRAFFGRVSQVKINRR